MCRGREKAQPAEHDALRRAAAALPPLQGHLRLVILPIVLPCSCLPAERAAHPPLQGHLRLVILPIVYNAMSQKPELRQTLLFRALHRWAGAVRPGYGGLEGEREW